MVVLGISLGLGSGVVGAFVAVALILGLAAAVYVARAVDPAWILSLGIAAVVFAARGSKLGVPVGPSRLLLAAGSLALIARATDGFSKPFPLKPRPIHWLLVVVVAWSPRCRAPTASPSPAPPARRSSTRPGTATSPCAAGSRKRASSSAPM